MRKLIIEIQKGGLGDHFFFSHLPRIAKETGVYDEVYISNASLFRHPDYRKLVWETNPYINGFVDEPGIFHFTETVTERENLLDRIMLLYGLDDGKRFHEPEVYYRPVVKPELKNAVIYDPNFISYTGDLANGKPIETWLSQNHVTVDFQMKQLNKRSLSIRPTAASLETTSLFDFCSVIVSAKKIYCLNTGTPSLAAALNIPVTVFYGKGLEERYRHSKMHQYICLGSNYGFKETLIKWTVRLLRKFIPLGTP
ncbi:MAG: hypothetical protein V4450_01040 [Bacteroidota bacterium]